MARKSSAQAARKPAARDTPRHPELGASVHFEHVNFPVDDHRPATAYFVVGLGLTRDPYRMVGLDNMWVNAGHQQFHLPLGPATPFPGEVHVTVPDLAQARAGLERAAELLHGTAFTWEAARGTLATCDPWGHAVRIHAADDLPRLIASNGLAIPWVTFHVPPGAAEGIAAFYARVVRCPATVEGRKGAREAVVAVGPYQHFRFAEQAGAAADTGHTNHVALYLTRYWEIHDDMAERGLITRAHAREQFRFRDIVHPEDGTLLFRMEHELRTLYHPDFRQPLTNRRPVPYPGL